MRKKYKAGSYKELYRQNKKSKGSGLKHLLMLSITVGALLAILYAYNESNAVAQLIPPIAIKAIGCITGIICYIALFEIVFKIIRYRRMAGATIHDIDKMSGLDFEKYLKKWYDKNGYKVKLTPASGDFGADLIVKSKNTNTTTCIQAKRYRSRVGVEAVQQAIASREYYKSDKAAVVTNSYYTDAAKEMARRTGTILINRSMLEKGRLAV